jgi:hypothetical protein
MRKGIPPHKKKYFHKKKKMDMGDINKTKSKIKNIKNKINKNEKVDKKMLK